MLLSILRFRLGRQISSKDYRMTNLKSLLEITADEWLQALKLPAEDIPDIVIIEGSWWRAQRTEWRLSYLTDVRELEFPDIFWGVG